MMKGFNIFINDGEDWVLLPVEHGSMTDPKNAINVPQKIAITVPSSSYFGSLSTYTKSWLANRHLIAVTKPGITTFTPGTDHCYFFGTITSVSINKDDAKMEVDERAQKLVDEPITLSSNIVQTVYIKDFPAITNQVQCVTTEGGSTSPAWTTNQHAVRGIHVITTSHSTIKSTCTSNGQIIASKALDTESKDYTKLEQGGWAYWAEEGNRNEKTTASDASWWCQFNVPCERTFDKVKIKINMIQGYCHESPNFDQEVDYDSGYPFAIQIYNYSTSAWETLTTEKNPTKSDPNGYQIPTWYTLEVENVDNYYDYTNKWVSIGVCPGVQIKLDGKYLCGFQLFDLWVEYTHYSHQASEFGIASNTANTLTLDVDSGTYDTRTNRLNIDDEVDILYTEKEFIESHFSLDDLCNSITFHPTTIYPTFNLFNFERADNFFSDVNSRNTSYFIQKRLLTSGSGYNIEFYHKGDEPDEGLLVEDQTNFDGDDIIINWNKKDLSRQVIVKNKNTNAANPSSAALSDEIPIVLDRPDLPDSYLLGYATGVYPAVSAISDDFTIPLRSVQVSETTYAVRDAPDDKFHVGAKIHVHACPTTKGGVDYQLDQDSVIREKEWTQDEKCIIKCGYAEAVYNSSQQTMDQVLKRLSHDSTS